MLPTGASVRSASHGDGRGANPRHRHASRRVRTAVYNNPTQGGGVLGEAIRMVEVVWVGEEEGMGPGAFPSVDFEITFEDQESMDKFDQLHWLKEIEIVQGTKILLDDARPKGQRQRKPTHLL
eukprot:1703199-Rhodomonas_salina.2